MKLRLPHGLAVVVLTFLCARAPAQQLPLKTYGQAEGLDNLAVSALAQDAAGYLWIGTENGLFRFNGAGFRRYGHAEGLGEDYLSTLLGSRSTGMWAATYDNLFHVEDDRLVPVLFEGKPIGAPPGQVLAEADGRVLFATDDRLLAIAPRANGFDVRPVFTAAQLRATPALDRIASIYVDADGSLWIGCRQAVCRAAGGRVTVSDDRDGLPADAWTSIVRDAEGTLWVRSAKRVFARPPGAARFEDRTPAGIGKRILRTELHVGPDGRLLTNDDGGVVRWDRGQWQRFGAQQGLHAGGGVTAMLQDREHGMWLGTLGHGLVHWLGCGNLENWSTAEGLPDDVVISVQRDAHGILHVGTRSGHAWQVPGERGFRVAAIPEPAHTREPWASMAVDTADRLWAGTYGGTLLRRAPEGGPPALMDRQALITHVLADRGQVWVSSKTGLHVLPEDAPPGTPPRAVSLPAVAGRRPDAPVAEGCVDPRGSLWFAGRDNVFHYDGAAWRVVSFGATLHGNPIWSMACSRDGTLLAAAQEAMWRLHPLGSPRAERIDAPVLRGHAIHVVGEDSRGWIWAGLDVGYAVWNGTRWRLLDQSHGLAWNDSNGRGAYEDRDGSMWLITSNGLSHVLHPDRLFVPIPRSAVIEDVLRGDHPMPAGSAALPWAPDQIVFRLASLQYEDRQGLRYRFRLLGADERWYETTQPEVRYGALPGGEYRFQLVVVDSDTGEQSPMAERVFAIAPPWWRSTPFYALCAAGIAGAFFAFHRLRLRAHRARAAQLTALVSERTRELEASREEMRVRALKDGLTQCWNRVAMMDIVEREIEKCVRSGEPFALVLLDLDHFKRVNDTYGHLAGDAVLVETARRLRAAVRPYDAVGRYGGEEFIVVLPGLNLPADAGRIDALRAAVRGQPVDIGDGQALAVTGSFGVVPFKPGTALDPVALLGRADEALYRSKHGGRDRISYAD